MRVVVAGGRTFDDREFVYGILDRVHERHEIDMLIHGGCHGADTIAGEWAEERGIEVRVVEANWDAYGRKAGPIRNRLMLKVHYPGLVVVFPGGHGTAHLRREAEKRGHQVFIPLYHSYRG